MRRGGCEEEDTWNMTLVWSVYEYSYVSIHVYMYNYIYASVWGAGGMGRSTLVSSVYEYSYVCIHMYVYNHIYASVWGAGSMGRRTLVLSANLRRAHSGTANVWVYICMCTHVCKYIYVHQHETKAICGGEYLCSTPTCDAPRVELWVYEYPRVCKQRIYMHQ